MIGVLIRKHKERKENVSEDGDRDQNYSATAKKYQHPSGAG